MSKVYSSDGTAIAFERSGDGPPLILVVGAFNERATGAPLAAFLAPHFTVFNYDRRGRGESGDTQPYSIDREIDDLAALVDEAGGSAAVFGYSSGACLALQAAARGLAITKLALYEPPYLVDGEDEAPRPMANHVSNLSELLAAGRRGEAVEYYQEHVVGIPHHLVVQFRDAPFRPGLEQIANTLVYDATLLGDRSLPTRLVASVAAPTLVIAGGASFAFMAVTARALAEALPNGRARVLDGQTHDISPPALGPVLAAFLAGAKGAKPL